MGNIQRPFDSRLEHRALGSVALTATAVLGTITQQAAMRTEFATVVNIEAIDIANSDELYTLVVELSSDNFTTVNEVATIHDFGDTAVRQSGAPNSAAGDSLTFEWSTEINGAVYQYARLKLFVAGTTPSITLGVYSSID